MESTAAMVEPGRRRWWLVGGSALAILVLLVVVLGAWSADGHALAFTVQSPAPPG